jgi:NADH dehydrogenase
MPGRRGLKVAFLPFYIPKEKSIRVVILGGGYAGLAALISLHRYCPTAQVTLVDGRPHHVKITHLQETLRRPLQDFTVPFPQIARRFACRYIQGNVALDEAELLRAASDSCLIAGGEALDFDYLVIAVGSVPRTFERTENVFDLTDFMHESGSVILNRLLERCALPCVWSIVGGGATGIQFVFEMAYWLRRRGVADSVRLRLIDADDAVLKQFTQDFARYAEARMADLCIDFYRNGFYVEQTVDTIRIDARDSGEVVELPSAAVFLFPGKRIDWTISTNAFGQVMAEGQVLERVFAAGDCASFRSLGTNTLTAQAAVRKGKLVARNLLRHSGRLPLLEPYLHQDLGYVVSLGPEDAVGWIGLEGNIVAGFPAVVVKELVEAQYDLLLAGIDTYLI